jgi:hypothetical protein
MLCAPRVNLSGHFLYRLSLTAISHVLRRPRFVDAFATGGLDETVNESVIHACMLPFGEIKDVNIPLDQQTQLNKGFGFITFVEK